MIESVQGSSESTYIFGIGGLSKSAMIAEARAQMLSNADMEGRSRAIVNETVEISHSFFPLVRRYKVIVSGYIIEFVE